MNVKLVSAFVAFGVLVGGSTWLVATSIASSKATATSSANTEASAEAIATAIANDPELCPKAENGLDVPTNEEATLAFRNRPNLMKFNNKESKDVVKLGTCYKGSMSMVQCGADIDFGGNGKFQQRSLGFDKTPSGWTAILF